MRDDHGSPRRKGFRVYTAERTQGQQHGTYVRPPDDNSVLSNEVAERIRIELARSRTDDYMDAPARVNHPPP